MLLSALVGCADCKSSCFVSAPLAPSRGPQVLGVASCPTDRPSSVRLELRDVPAGKRAFAAVTVDVCGALLSGELEHINGNAAPSGNPTDLGRVELGRQVIPEPACEVVARRGALTLPEGTQAVVTIGRPPGSLNKYAVIVLGPIAILAFIGWIAPLLPDKRRGTRH